MTNGAVIPGEKRDIVVTRTFDAPLELVWRAWTEPEHVMRWWGPKDYTSPFCRVDFRKGGSYLFAMRAPDYQGGLDYYTGGVYFKIVPRQLIEFSQVLSDQDGNPLDPAQAGLPPDFPAELRMRLVFKDLGARTELTITEYDWTVGQMYEYSILGMNQSLDKLAQSIAAA